MKQTWVGLSGKARHGKDEAAKCLIDEFNFQRIASADAVKRICMTYVNGTPSEREGSNYRLATELFQDPEAASAVDALMQEAQPGVWKPLTYEDAYINKTQESRRLMCAIGDGMRHIVPGRSDVWIRYSINKVRSQPGRYAITDVRYPNEVELLLTMPNSAVYRLRRDSIPSSDHASEIALDNYRFDTIVKNNGTIEELHVRVKKLVKKLIESEPEN